jgi:hypothetical protein
MKSEKKRWQLSPPVIVVLTALIVLSVLLLLEWLNARQYRLTAQVEIAAPVIDQLAPQKTGRDSALQWPEGEVARTAERVREASALLMGLALLVINEELNHRHHTQASTLLTLMTDRELLPPKLQRASDTELASPYTKIVVRYQSILFGLEVLSLGNTPADGPPIIARLTSSDAASASTVLLIAKKYNALIPASFAPLSEIQVADWSVEPLRERSLSPEESEQLHTWAQQYSATGK